VETKIALILVFVPMELSIVEISLFNMFPNRFPKRSSSCKSIFLINDCGSFDQSSDLMCCKRLEVGNSEGLLLSIITFKLNCRASFYQMQQCKSKYEWTFRMLYDLNMRTLRLELYYVYQHAKFCTDCV